MQNRADSRLILRFQGLPEKSTPALKTTFGGHSSSLLVLELALYPLFSALVAPFALVAAERLLTDHFEVRNCANFEANLFLFLWPYFDFLDTVSACIA